MMTKPRKFIDISVALESGIPSDPPIMLPEIDYFDHSMTPSRSPPTTAPIWMRPTTTTPP